MYEKAHKKHIILLTFKVFFNIINTGTFIYPTYVSPGKTYECYGERKIKNENIHAKKRRCH